MNELAQILYQKFFLRDLLGKIVPGAVFVGVLLWLFYPLPVADTQQASQPYLLDFLLTNFGTTLLAFGALWVLGFAVQTLSEFPFIRPILFASWPRPWDKNSSGFHTERLALFVADRQSTDPTATASQGITPDHMAQRERFVVIKEACGNTAFGIALGIAAYWAYSIGFAWPQPPCRFSLIILSSCSLVLWVAHVIHRRRQAAYELRALRNAKQITHEKAELMWRNAGRPKEFSP